MTYEQLSSMMGCKYYKQKEDGEYEILRVINIKGTDTCVCLIDDKEEKLINPADILSVYTKLIPDGIISFAIVSTRVNPTDARYTDDVIVTVTTSNSIETKQNVPDIICRQNIVDIFYAMYSGKEDTEVVGTCLTRNEIPSNLPIEMITHFDKMEYIVTYNTYITDTVFDFLKFMKGKRLRRFDTVLSNGLEAYMKKKGIPDMGQSSVKGHCRDLETLLRNNNFEYDMDQVYSITPIKLDVSENLITNKFANGDEYQSLNSELVNIFSKVFKMKISKTIVLKYWHDIDLSEFHENEVFLVRDITNSVYVVRYTTEGKYIESELEIAAVQQAMENIRIVNKYGSKKG